MAKQYLNGILQDISSDEWTKIQAERQTQSDNKFNSELARIRSIRNQLLAETDHLALSDNTLTTEMTTYRQSLRDITNNVDDLDDINNITWPTKPGA